MLLFEHLEPAAPEPPGHAAAMRTLLGSLARNPATDVV
jgi:hypothetical protein